jgi:hypothetical protein
LIQKAIAYYVKGAEEFRKEPRRMLRLIWFKPIKRNAQLRYTYFNYRNRKRQFFSFAHGMDFPEYQKNKDEHRKNNKL